MGKLSWIIWVGSKCDHKCPGNTKAEDDLTQTKEKKAM